MSRKIPNRPHPTPDPEKPHGGSRIDWSGLARMVPGHSEQADDQRADADPEEPNYDSCFDDLNMVLAQSMQRPDPDPNLESAGDRDGTDPELGLHVAQSGKAPRTSEIFRSVVAPAGELLAAAGSAPPVVVRDEPDGGSPMPDLGVLDRREGDANTGGTGDRMIDASIPWGQIVLLSYATVLTLALIWLLWTGQIPRAAARGLPAAKVPDVESVPHPADPAGDTPPPPLPPENLTRLGQPILLGDLQVTPLSVEAGPVELVHRIDSTARRREDDCLVLRLRLVNLSKDRTFAPMDRVLVRGRDLRVFDPYISTSEGRSIRLFPLAMESEWTILGQDFPVLGPGESGETSVVAEPGSADRMAGEMTWRVRLRIGIYRSDMIGVIFTRDEVRHRPF